MPGWIFALFHYPNGDKIGHFFLFGLLAFLINGSFPERAIKIFSVPIPAGCLLIAFLAALEEYSQSYFPSRTFSLLDLGCSLSGIAVFSLLSVYFIKRFYKNNLGVNPKSGIG
jgi:polysaccharide biosynthesis protein VpsQ